jgi:hypothetical protein
MIREDHINYQVEDYTEVSYSWLLRTNYDVMYIYYALHLYALEPFASEHSLTFIMIVYSVFGCVFMVKCHDIYILVNLLHM